MTSGIARRVTASGLQAGSVAAELSARLPLEGLQLVVVFADWRIDSAELARALHDALPAPVVGCTTIGLVGGGTQPAPTAAAIGLYGDWVKVGIGLATDLPRYALSHSRDAVHEAAAAIGVSAEALDASRHVAITFVDGSCGQEEAFCIASAATAPQIRYVGGSAATEIGTKRRSIVWARGKTFTDAGIVVLLESTIPFEAVTSQHMIATDIKTVVTSCDGRVIDELDGHAAAPRLHELVRQLGGTLDESKPSEYSLARFVDNMPYLRSMTHIDGRRIHLACAVEAGHILRLMRPGDLIARTRQDLADVAGRLGGELSALLAFSCIGRHWEAAARGIEQPLADAYAEYPTIGFQSFGEQTGMLLVNHTLTGLALGTRR